MATRQNTTAWCEGADAAQRWGHKAAPTSHLACFDCARVERGPSEQNRTEHSEKLDSVHLHHLTAKHASVQARAVPLGTVVSSHTLLTPFLRGVTMAPRQWFVHPAERTRVTLWRRMMSGAATGGVFACVVAMAVAAPPRSWRPSGITGGGAFFSPGFHPSDASVLTATTDMGAVRVPFAHPDRALLCVASCCDGGHIVAVVVIFARKLHFTRAREGAQF